MLKLRHSEQIFMQQQQNQSFHDEIDNDLDFLSSLPPTTLAAAITQQQVEIQRFGGTIEINDNGNVLITLRAAIPWPIGRPEDCRQQDAEHGVPGGLNPNGSISIHRPPHSRNSPAAALPRGAASYQRGDSLRSSTSLLHRPCHHHAHRTALRQLYPGGDRDSPFSRESVRRDSYIERFLKT
jgi:hypothetical protein